MPTRALALIRLSRMTDATTSPERQEKDIRRYCQAHDIEIVGIASDTDVSGSIDPMDRPALGPWLRERLEEFDVIVASKLDRVGRNARQIHALMDYLINARKSLATAGDNIDISTPHGRMIVYVMATTAEMERIAIQQRNRGAAQHNIQAGKYRGGLPPIGYRAVKDSAGDWRLTPDEEGTAPVVREIVKRIQNGERVASIVQDLNRRGVPTHKDRQAELKGRERKPSSWTISNTKRLLLSPAILGYVVTGEDNRIMYGDDGEPITRTDTPVIPLSDYYSVRRILTERSETEPRQNKSAETSLLTGILFCATCGGSMFRLKGGPGRQARYRCGSTAKGGSCGNGSVLFDEANEHASRIIRNAFAFIPHVRREYVAGTNHGETLAEIDGELSSLAESVVRFPAGSPALTALLAKVDNLTAKRDELAALPETQSGWKYVPTGQTFGQYWDGLNTTERNDFLREHGYRIEVTKPTGEAATYKMSNLDGLGLTESINPEFGKVVRDIVESSPLNSSS